MASIPETKPWHELALEAGEQAVVNGAILSADAPVRIRVGAGANVFTAEQGAAKSARAPVRAAGKLYYTTLLCHAQDPTLECERAMLFEELAKCVASFRTRRGQVICTEYAAALMQGDGDLCLRIARRLTAAS